MLRLRFELKLLDLLRFKIGCAVGLDRIAIWALDRANATPHTGRRFGLHVQDREFTDLTPD
eukprot:259377-Pyramimonas_sp.AAC.1